MKNKKKGITAYIIIITVVAVIVYAITYHMTYNGVFDRTYEEYVSILADNKDDFEYVARTMHQWDKGSIRFENSHGSLLDFDNLAIKNPEIKSEISNNEDFNMSLHNLYELNEINLIVLEEGDVMFYYSKPPQNGYGYIIYKEDINMDGVSSTQTDENWRVELYGNM